MIWCDDEIIPELSPIGFWKSICLDRASGRIPQLSLAHLSPRPFCGPAVGARINSGQPRKAPAASVVNMSWDQDVSASKLQASSSADRRRFIRAATVLKARLLTPLGNVEATILDASLNGVKLWTASDVPVGIKVSLLLAGAVHFGGEVVWRREDTVGLCFRDDPEKVATIMAALLPQRCLQVGHA